MNTLFIISSFAIFKIHADLVIEDNLEKDERQLLNGRDGLRVRRVADVPCTTNEQCVTLCNTDIKGACGFMKASGVQKVNNVLIYTGEGNDSTCKDLKCDCDCKSSCFSHRSIVHTSHGDSTLQNIQVGDLVQTMSGLEPVIGFLHDSDHSADFLSIKHDQGVLEITDSHLVYLEDGTPVPAEYLKIGDRLSTTGEASAVRDISRIQLNGFSAPLTPSGTIIVNGIAASVYAQMSTLPEWVLHLALAPLRAAYKLSWNSTPKKSVVPVVVKTV